MARQKLTHEQRIKHRRRIRRQIVGTIFFVLAVLGVVFIATQIYNRVSALLDDSEDKIYYADLYAPIVSMDPVAFSSIEKADADLLLEAAIWSAFNNEDSSKFQTNEMGQTLIAKIDVDRWATRMYGKAYKLTHHTFTDVNDGSVSFEYDAESEYYTLPITSQAGNYQAVVESITTTGNTRTLRMAYIDQDSEYVDYSGSKEEASVYKYMDYILIRESGEFYLYAIATVETQP